MSQLQGALQNLSTVDPDYSSEVEEMPVAGGPKEELTEDGTQIQRDATGITVILDASATQGPAPSTAFDGNLADHVPKAELDTIAAKIIEWADVDEQSRLKWVERIKEGAKLLGLEELSDDDGVLPGASKLTHPMIAEVAVQFQARAIEEMFPSGGPVSTIVLGTETEEKRDQGDRVQNYLNYHLTERDEGYFDDLDQMLFLEPCHGSIFRKTYRDPIDGLVKSRFVTADNFLVPYSARSLADAPRYTHRFNMGANNLKRAMANGAYRTVELTEIAVTTPTAMQEVLDKADDKAASVVIEDNEDHELLECHCDFEISIDKSKAKFDLPYIITIDKSSQEVLSIRRNWKESDARFKKRIWFSHFKYLPGLGFYGFGLLHIIGVLAKACGGTLRALLDAAAMSNFQGGFKSKDCRLSGDVTIEPGKWKDTDMTSEELRASFYTPEFGEPSPTLFKLLDYMVSDGRRFASVVDAMVGDSPVTGPVGTTIAQIEQGSKVFSGVHKRNHKSQRDEFRQMVQLHSETMEPVYPYEMQGVSRQIFRMDFDDRIDVVPVSDPSIYSSSQRIALAQGSLQLVESAPDIYDKDARVLAHKRLLKAMKVPMPEEFFPRDKHRCDPVTENQLILTGKPVTAFPEQDHRAHMQVHMQFMSGIPDPALLQQVTPVMQAHMAEHYAYQYRNEVMQRVPIDPINLDKPPQEMSVEMESLVAKAVANTMPMGQGAGGGPPPDPAVIQQQMEELGKQQAEMVKAKQQIDEGVLKLKGEQQNLAGMKIKMDAEHQAFLASAALREREIKHSAAEAMARVAAAELQLSRKALEVEKADAQIDVKLEGAQNRLSKDAVSLSSREQAQAQAEAANALTQRELAIERRANELELLEGRLDSKLQDSKNILTQVKTAPVAEPTAETAAATARADALLNEVIGLGKQIQQTLTQPKVREVTKRDGMGRIDQVVETMKKGTGGDGTSS